VLLPLPGPITYASRTSDADAAEHALHQVAAFAGFAAYVMMVATIAWGTATALGVARRHVARETVVRTHIALSIGALAFLSTHITANVVAPSAGLSVLDAVVPYAGTGTALSLGVLGTELTVVVAASTWFRRRVSPRAWHRVHLLAHPAYVLSIAHVLMAGSDVGHPLLAALLVVTVVVLAVVWLVRVGSWLGAARRVAAVHRREATVRPGAGAPTLRVDVDHTHCGRYAFCQQAAPEVFQLSSAGRLHVQHAPDARHRDAVHEAARLCPMQAISVHEH
jgi:ferredoxin/DMSO/TMAO reductase YedYZ heme-binding membrane subunit